MRSGKTMALEPRATETRLGNIPLKGSNLNLNLKAVRKYSQDRTLFLHVGTTVPCRISPYIKPGSKRFLSWDKCRGLNFALEVGPFCVVSLVTLQNRSFEHLATISARLSFTTLGFFRLKIPRHVQM